MKNQVSALLFIILNSFSLSGFAATPANGSLNLGNRVLEFSNGPNIAVNPTSFDRMLITCQPPLFGCDSFDLNIELPDNLAEFYPEAIITMIIGWDDPNGTGVEDYDIFLYDTADNLITQSDSSGNPESMHVLAEGGQFDYRIDIIYFTVFGSTYTGVIELLLGDPAPDADIDAFWAEHGLERPFENRSFSNQQAGGNLNLALFLLLIGGLARQLRKFK